MKKVFYWVVCSCFIWVMVGCNNSGDGKNNERDTTGIDTLGKDTLHNTDEGVKPPQTNSEF